MDGFRPGRCPLQPQGIDRRKRAVWGRTYKGSRVPTPTAGCRWCQFQRYLRIRADRAEINANVAMLFANGVCERDLPRDSSMPSDLVMICQWASLFTQSMDSRMTICSGGS